MNVNDRGLGLTAKQARVLLKFASKEDSDRNKRVVKVVIETKRAHVRATNGVISLELDGEANGKFVGEWSVDRSFFERAVRLVVGVKAILRLHFNRTSLKEALVEENDLETSSFHVPVDAAIADVEFPWGKEGLKVPSRTRKVAACSSLPGQYAALLQEVEDAVGANYTDLYPPQSPDHPWVFVCNDGGATVARGTLKAAKSVAATTGGEDDGEDSEDGDEEPKAGKGKPAAKGKKGKRPQLELV
jgi:hypothetical protein